MNSSRDYFAERFLCGAPTEPPASMFFYRCLRPAAACDGTHMPASAVCPSCYRTVDPATLYGPASPARLDGPAILHRVCAERLAAERSGVAA